MQREAKTIRTTAGPQLSYFDRLRIDDTLYKLPIWWQIEFGVHVLLASIANIPSGHKKDAIF